MKNIKRITTCIFLLLFCFSIKAQNQFTNNGNFKIHSGGTVTFYGDFVNNSAFVDSGQVITLGGTAAQQIGGSSPVTFKNLVLNNTAGSYLSANESISRELTISAGTFSTTGYDFTLISDANGTARIAPILGNFSGNITMQRYIGSGPSDWRFLASPVSGVTINDWQDDFITSGFPGSTYPAFTFTSIYTYDESVAGVYDNGYVGASSSSDQLVPGKGYWCYIGPAPLTVDVTGPPIKFIQTFPVTYSASAGPVNDGWQMIGNPYPSPIDWNSASWTKTNINSAIYIWNPALQQFASWISGVSTNGGSNIIASSQSFWIQTNAANPVLACNENIKSSTSPSFLKPAAAYAMLKLNIEGSGYRDETILRFGSGATTGYDPDADARKAFSSNYLVPGISTLDSTKADMSVNSLPMPLSLINIPVRTLVGVTDNYTITLDSSSEVPPGFCLILEDLLTGALTSMSNGNTYTCMITDTTKAARFVLRVSPSHHTESISASCNKNSDGRAIAKTNGLGPWNYLWFDNTNTTIKQTVTAYMTDTLYNLSAGDYMVQISDIKGLCGFFTHTVTVSEPLPIVAGFSLSNDTLYTGSSDSLVMQNMSTGAIGYQWNFGDGSPSDSSLHPANHHFASAGEYTVTLVAFNSACSDTLTRKITVLAYDLTRLTENQRENIKIYPNPGNGLFYINIPNNDVVSYNVQFFTASGVKVHEQALSGGNNTLNLVLFAKGIYFYTILFTNNQNQNGKLIIQ